jgi:hypothetical protein
MKNQANLMIHDLLTPKRTANQISIKVFLKAESEHTNIDK